MSTAVQYELTDLLEQSGARPRGNRHDCPKCGGLRTITHTPECFYCHKCQWKGNIITLAKEVGVFQPIPAAEYQEIRQREQEARDAAGRLYRAVKARRFELYEDLRVLARIERGAHKAGLDQLEAWDALALVYEQRPIAAAELGFIEDAHAENVMRFLVATPAQRQAVCNAIIERGGFFDHAGRFVEVNWNCESRSQTLEVTSE